MWLLRIIFSSPVIFLRSLELPLCFLFAYTSSFLLCKASTAWMCTVCFSWLCAIVKSVWFLSADIGTQLFGVTVLWTTTLCPALIAIWSLPRGGISFVSTRYCQVGDLSCADSLNHDCVAMKVAHQTHKHTYTIYIYIERNSCHRRDSRFLYFKCRPIWGLSSPHSCLPNISRENIPTQQSTLFFGYHQSTYNYVRHWFAHASTILW